MNSISQLPNHAPRKIGSLFWFRKKKCWAFKEEGKPSLSFLAFLPLHHLTTPFPQVFLIRSVSFCFPSLLITPRQQSWLKVIFHKGPFLTYQRDKATLAILKLGPLDPGGLLHPRSYFSRASPQGGAPPAGLLASWELAEARRGVSTSLLSPRESYKNTSASCSQFGISETADWRPKPLLLPRLATGNLGPGIIHCFEFPALKHPHLSALRPQWESAIPARLAPGWLVERLDSRGEPRGGGKGWGEAPVPAAPRAGVAASPDAKGSKRGRGPVSLFTRERALHWERKTQEKSARAFVLVFRLFASQLKSGRLGDSFAVFTV